MRTEAPEMSMLEPPLICPSVRRDGAPGRIRTSGPQWYGPPPAEPRLGGQLAHLLGAGRQDDAKFMAAVPATEHAIRTAGKAGSDSWVAAEQALSRLETDRTQTSVAAADLNTLMR